MREAGSNIVPAEAGHFVDCAFLSCLLFAVHPLRVEVVCWASCQPHLCAAIFTPISLGAYLEHRRSFGATSLYWKFKHYTLLLLATWSEAVVVGLPFALVVLDIFLHMCTNRPTEMAPAYADNPARLQHWQRAGHFNWDFCRCSHQTSKCY
jgi:hypothetical protein